MTRGRTITFKYKHFKYDENIKRLLSVPLNAKDEISLNKLYNNYEALGIRRGYEYIIKDLYILIEKHSISTADIAKIYEVGVRTVQIWLKELGLNRTLKEAQKIAVTKRGEKIDKSTSPKSLPENVSVKEEYEEESYIKSELNRLLTERLRNCEVIVGVNALGVINSTNHFPVIVIKNDCTRKFLIRIGDFISKGSEVDKNEKIVAENKGYKYLEFDVSKNIADRMVFRRKLLNLHDEIIKDMEGIIL